MGDRIRQMEQCNTSFQSDFRANLKTTMSTSTSSRRQRNMALNPELVKSQWLDSSNKQVVPEHYRITCFVLKPIKLATHLRGHS